MTTPRRVAVVTGSRAEFGLLRPVMAAIATRPDLELAVIVAGSHLVSPALTFRDVKAHFPIADTVPMQVAGRVGRVDDAEAVGRGIARFTRTFHALEPDWVVVLGDRIEAFAAAAAASIGGWSLAHIHGGDRAEGVADEAMRHAVTKLAHLHLAATAESAQRITRMGEDPARIRVIGSPAIDGLHAVAPADDATWHSLGAPDTLLLLHPVGRSDDAEQAAAEMVIAAIRERRVLAMLPNLDPGRRGIVQAISASGLALREHLPRDLFVAVLKRLAAAGGVLIGNSSAGLIEAAAIGVRVIDVGRRQEGRERASNVVHADESPDALHAALETALALDPLSSDHPYGDGRAGERAAAVLAEIDPRAPGFTRKRNTY